MSGERNSSGHVAPMALAALGVVFGDIGTSPLYAVSACFTGPHIAVTPEHIFGVLSLIFWSLVLVILLKYVAVVLNADNKGEGGVLALTALVINTERASPRRKIYGTLGILGASLFFAAGVRWWKFVLVLLPIPFAARIVYSHLHDYQRARIDTFLNPATDPLGAGYNIIQIGRASCRERVSSPV